MELSNAKGTRDFPPEEKIVRDKVALALKEVFELYGFAPLETPIIERYDVLASKYAGGAEILRETFKFRDQGERDLALRYDLTVPLCRFMGMNPNTKLPFKRYQIGEVFRDGPIGTARYRQFTQCDVDVIGASSLASDAEIIALIYAASEKLGLPMKVRFNSRKLLNDILDYCGIPKEKQEPVILAIDKLDKFGADTVRKEIKALGIEESKISKVMDFTGISGDNEKKLSQLSKLLKNSSGLDEIKQLCSCLSDAGSVAEFDVSLARGLSYYTGTVIETFLTESSIKSAVCSGGRYDNIIGSFLGKGVYPAMGVSFGLDRLYDALVEKEQLAKKTNTKVYVVPIKALAEGIKIVQKLRQSGIKSDIDLLEKGPSKNLDYANALGIPFVLFVGKKELEQGKFKLRDMTSGQEEMLDLLEILEKLKE
jgi:histidyl-tRNA synthetase